MPAKKKKRLLKAGAFLCITALVVSLAAVRLKSRASSSSLPENTISETKVRRGTVSNTISGSGSLEYTDAQDISIPTGIVIDEIKVAEGDIVKKGQLLATVDTDSLNLSIQEIQASIEEVDEKLSEVDEDSTTKTVTAPLSGTVESVNISSGDDAAEITSEKGSTIVLTSSGSSITLTETSGTVSAVYVSAGDSVDQGDTLYKLKNVQDDREKNELLKNRREMTEALEAMMEIKKNGGVISDMNGLIRSVSLTEGEEVTKSTGSGSDSGGSENISGTSTGNTSGSSTSGSSASTSSTSTGYASSGEQLSVSYISTQSKTFTLTGTADSGNEEGAASQNNEGSENTASGDDNSGDDTSETDQKVGNDSSGDSASSGSNSSSSTNGNDSADSGSGSSDSASPENTSSDSDAGKGAEKGKASKKASALKLPLTAPSAGNKPMSLDDLASALSSYGISTSSLTWYHSGTEMSSDESFQAGEKYRAELVLKLSDEASDKYTGESGDMDISASGSSSLSYELDGSVLKVYVDYELEKDSGADSGHQGDGNSSGSNNTGSGSSTSQNSKGQGDNSSVGSASSGSASSGMSGSSGSTASDSSAASGSTATDASSSSSQEEYSMYETVGFTISAQDKMKVSINVTELDILSIQEGQSATIELEAIEGETFEGSVTEISSEGSSSGGSVKYPVTIEIEKSDIMLTGMSATATITISSSENVLTIPAVALQERGGRSFVYTANEDGELSGEVDVETGLSDDSTVEITSGLDENQSIYYSVPTGTDIESGSSDQMMMNPGGMTGGDSFQGGGPGGDGGNMPSGGPGGQMPGGNNQ